MEEQEWTAMEEKNGTHNGVTQDYSDIDENGDPQEFHANTCDECGGMIDEETGMCNECGYMNEHAEDGDPQYQRLCECGGMMNEDGICNECGQMNEHAQDGDPENVCPKCGKQICECSSGMYESKKKVLRLKESELVKLIKNMVSESMKGEPGAPGIPGVYYTEKSQRGSGKENKDALNAVDKKMKDYLNIDGNDHSEFPHQNGVKAKKEAYRNTDAQDKETAKNFAGLQNLDYDLEPSEQFKKRLKMAIEGDTLMGNAPTTEAPKIKPSNGADKGKEAKEKQGNHIPTPETAKNMETQMKDRQKDKDNRVLYSKEAVPFKESKVSFSNVLLEEMNKMKKLSTYNKKTQ